MARPTLKVSPRAATGTSANRQLRRNGEVPAVIYGNGIDPVAVAADPKQIVAILNSPLGRNTPLDLSVDGEKASRLAIIKDFQVHPVKRRLLHLDFWQVSPDQEVEVKVPFRKTGRAAAEKIGAKVRLTVHDVLVRCKPDNIPAAIEHDMTDVAGDLATISISQVTLPEGVEAIYKHDYSVLQLKIPRVEEEDVEEGEGEEGEAAEAAAE